MKIASTICALALATSAVAASPTTPDQPVATVSVSQSAERLELARRDLGLVDPGKNIMTTMRSFIRKAALERVTDASFLPQAEGRLDQMMAMLEPDLEPFLPPIVEAYAQAYAREFDAAELQEMIIFARSPAGRHYLERAIAIETDPLVLHAAMQLFNNIVPAIEKHRRQMCGQHAAERVAAGDSKARCPLSSQPAIGKS